MILGMRPRLAALVAGGLLLVGLLTGCGGSGGDGGPNPPGPTPATNATITGRVLDSSATPANSPAQNVTVRLGQYTGNTGSTGRFTITVPNGTAVGNLTLEYPQRPDGAGAQYYAEGYYSGVFVNYRSTGVSALSGSTITARDEPYDVGTFTVFSTDGPPPPPLFNN